jgi:hypothetical protein
MRGILPQLDARLITPIPGVNKPLKGNRRISIFIPVSTQYCFAPLAELQRSHDATFWESYTDLVIFTG